MALPILAIAAIGLASGLMSSKLVQSQASTQAEADHLTVIRDLDANRRESSALFGAQKATFAFSGVDVSTGSPAVIAAETLENAWREQKTISDIGNAQIAANLSAGKSSGEGALLSGVGGAAASIFGG